MSVIMSGIGQATESTTITETTNQQVQGGAAQTQAQGSQALSASLGAGASLSVYQDNPLALEVARASTQYALDNARAQVDAASMLAGQAIDTALSTAKDALTPESAKTANTITVLIIGAVIVGAIYFMQKG